MAALDGIFLLDKPAGMSSHTAMRRAQRLFDANKAGHTGCLDPLATGLLPVCFGQATKYIDFLLSDHKTYFVTAKLGETRTTGDADGEILAQVASDHLSESMIVNALTQFSGPILQVPPRYSALKYQGKPYYAYAREGIEIPRPHREVTIFSCDLLSWSNPYVSLRVRCSKGTYIRSLIETLGETCGVGAHVVTLRREAIDAFANLPMYTLEALSQAKAEERLVAWLIPLQYAVKHLPTLSFSQAQRADLFCGKLLNLPELNDGLYQAYSEEDFFGTVFVEAGILKAKRLLAA